MSDLLNTPLKQWSATVLQELVGRVEGQTLEAKGPEIGLSSRDDRQKLARSVAGFVSARGGVLIIGATERNHTVVELPGIEASTEDVRRLETALRDLVEPIPLISVRSFEVDQQRLVVVIEVSADPAGRPAMVRGGKFFIRLGDATVPLSYTEIERRMSGFDVGIREARSNARNALHEASSRRPEGESSPIGVAVSPVQTRFDLGRTGSELVPVWWEVVTEATQAAQDADRLWSMHLTQLPGATVTGHGIDVAEKGLKLEVDYSGVATLLLSKDALGQSATNDQALIYEIATQVSRWVGVILALQRRIGLGGSVLLHLSSGGIEGLSSTANTNTPHVTVTGDVPFVGDMRRGPITAEAVVPLWGHTADSAAEGVTLFVSRLFDNIGRPHAPAVELDLQRSYLTSLLPPTSAEVQL